MYVRCLATILSPIGSEVRFVTLSSTKKLRLRYLAILIREERNKMTKHCPKCGSAKTKTQAYMDINILICEKCGYDESALYEIYPEHKTSQKAKGQFSPYKTGGSKRTK